MATTVDLPPGRHTARSLELAAAVRPQRLVSPASDSTTSAGPTTATVLDGVDVKTAQARVGHSDARLSLAIYAQATQEGDRRAG